MESTGPEKKIQALFSETSLYDRSTAPAFEKLWARAETGKPLAKRSSSKLLLAVTTVLIAAVSAFSAWSWYRSTAATTQHDASITPEPVVSPLPLEPAPQLAQNSKRTPVIRNRAVHQKRFTRATQLPHAAINEAALLSSWQSPTEALMQFSQTVDLSSLPQLNQSVEALKQFLPANTGTKKESNQ